jgi:hypothetical protein
MASATQSPTSRSFAETASASGFFFFCGSPSSSSGGRVDVGVATSGVT